MANTVDIKVLHDTLTKRIISVYISGDGTGEETDTVIYDFSADTNKRNASVSSGKIRRLQWANDSYDLHIEWAGATKHLITHLNQNDNGDFDFNFDTELVGLPNLATTPTGDIVISTVNLGAADHGSFILEILKE